MPKAKPPRHLPHIFQSEDASSHFILHADPANPGIASFMDRMKKGLEEQGTSGRLFRPGDKNAPNFEDMSPNDIQAQHHVNSPDEARRHLSNEWLDTEDEGHRKLLYPQRDTTAPSAGLTVVEGGKKAKGGAVKKKAKSRGR